jgi:hypothetical protein
MPPQQSFYDRFLQWGMNNIAGPMAPGLAQMYQQHAAMNGQAAQAQQNQYLGPEAQGHNPIARFGHGLASVGYDALGLGDKMLGGMFGMNPGQALLSAAAPELAGPIMAAQSAPDFWHMAHGPVTPDNVQNTALMGAALTGGAAMAARPTAPVGMINHAMPEAPAPAAVPFAEWPENYRQAGMQRLSNNVGGGANYTAGDLASLKAKYGIGPTPQGAAAAPALAPIKPLPYVQRPLPPNVAPEEIPSWMNTSDAHFAQQYPNAAFESNMPPNLESLYAESAGFKQPTPDIGSQVRSKLNYKLSLIHEPKIE